MTPPPTPRAGDSWTLRSCSARSCRRRRGALDHVAQRPRLALPVPARRPDVTGARPCSRPATMTAAGRRRSRTGSSSAWAATPGSPSPTRSSRQPAGARSTGRRRSRRRGRRVPRQHRLRLRRQPRRRLLGGAEPAVRAAHRGRIDGRQRARRGEAGLLRRARRLRRLRREVDGGVHALRPADVVGERAGQRGPRRRRHVRVGATLAAPAASAAATPAADVAPLAVVPDPTTGLEAETFSVDSDEHAASTRRRSARTGRARTACRSRTCGRSSRSRSSPLTGTTAHGALITELTSGDTDCINPVFARPIVDLTGERARAPFGDVAFPSKLQTVRTFVTPTGLQQRLVLVTGQFFTQHCTTEHRPAGRRAAALQPRRRPRLPLDGRRLRLAGVPADPRDEGRRQRGVHGRRDRPDADRRRHGQAGRRRASAAARQSVWTFVNLAQSGRTRPAGRAASRSAARSSSTSSRPSTPPATSPSARTRASTSPARRRRRADRWHRGEPDRRRRRTAGITGAPALNITAPAGVTFQVSVDGGPFGPAAADDHRRRRTHRRRPRVERRRRRSCIAPVDTTAPEIVVNTPAERRQYLPQLDRARRTTSAATPAPAS